MGWLSLRSRLQQPANAVHLPIVATNYKFDAENVEHIEHIENTRQAVANSGYSEFSFQELSVPDDCLPSIPPEAVRDQRDRFLQGQGCAWIVVNEIVYDCTDFIQQHPGGDTVIRSFIGEDCSWQFWRFHSKAIMETSGRPLRIGRTQGIKNRFPEPPRFNGPRRAPKLH